MSEADTGGGVADSSQAPPTPKFPPPAAKTADGDADQGDKRRRRGSRGGKNRSKQSGEANKSSNQSASNQDRAKGDSGGANQPNQGGQKKRRRRGGRGRGGNKSSQPSPAPSLTDAVELDEATLKRRRGRRRKGKPVGRYMMVVSKKDSDHPTQIAILEGRSLIEHYVSRPSDNITQIHGNIYVGRVQNVLPGMEAAFIDIGTPKNAVLYRGDVIFKKSDHSSREPKIEQLLKPRQTVLCQVTKNPIAHKGARLTTEVSIPGRFVVFVPNSSTYGISKRLPDNERKRLRAILDKCKPKEHGVIVRTAAEHVTAEEIERDVSALAEQWRNIEKMANSKSAPALLYSEPDMELRVIREEFNKNFRSVILDDEHLYDEVQAYTNAVTPALADRIEYYDVEAEGLSVFERHHIHEQLVRALDPKVWLPSGGSLIIEGTEALTVIDVNTGKNVGKSSLEETVFRNNLEAAEEIARQLRLRDIGGIIVIDFVDMEIRKNRDEVVRVFRDALSRDKTRTQVYDISDLGLVEMTRKRIGEGLLQSMSHHCDVCDGRGVQLDASLLDD